MLGSKDQRAQDQQVQRALEQFEPSSSFLGRHLTRVCSCLGKISTHHSRNQPQGTASEHGPLHGRGIRNVGRTYCSPISVNDQGVRSTLAHTTRGDDPIIGGTLIIGSSPLVVCASVDRT